MAHPFPADLDRPDSAWNRIAARGDHGDPFCCRTEWQFSFHEAFEPRRRLHFRSRGDSVIGFAERRDARFGRLLEPIESHWMFGCPLLGPDAPALLAALGDELGADGDPPTPIVSGVQPESELGWQLIDAFRARYRIFAFEPTVLRSASLAGGLDGYLSRRSGSWRRNLRAQGRRAAAAGVRFERHAPTTSAAVDAIYARILAVEATSWKGIGNCGMAEPPSRQFYGLMLRRLSASGGGRVMFARHGDRDIGFVFGGLAGRTYRGQQFSYADDWAPFSIGNLLQVEQLRWLTEEGVERYDMGPAMDYKRHWTEVETRIDTLLLQPRG
ncbi:MAG: GNAT family N-acetyltransferase [Planctomycetota bacterium]